MKSYVEEKRIRPDILTSAIFWSIIIMMLYNIISVRIFGDMGAGFCSGPSALYFLVYISFVLAVQKSVYIMVRLRARRSQFLNAEANMKKSFRVFTLAGILVALLIGFGSYYIAKNLLGAGKVYFELIIVAISAAFLCPQGVIRGYLQGLGYTKPIVIADILISATSFLSGGIISGFMFRYGKKVNDLFHGDEYSAIYGASGMVIGLLIGSVGGFVQIFVSYQLRKNEISRVVKDGAPRYLDNKNDVYTGIRSILYLYASPVLMCVVDNVFYNIIQMRNGNADTMISLYGAYSGRVICFVILLAFLCCMPFIKMWNRVMARIERDEFEGARERLKRLLHFTYMLLAPVATALFVSSDIVQITVYGKLNADINGMFQLGAVLLFFLALGIMSSWLLNHMGKSMLIVISLSVTWAVHVGTLILFELVLGWNLKGIVFAQIAAFVVYDVISLFMILKMLRVRSNILGNIGIPVVAAALSGLVLLAENKILVNVIGEVLTLILGLIIYFVVYMVLLIVLRGIRTHELENIPLGKFLMGFSSRIQHDRFYEE